MDLTDPSMRPRSFERGKLIDARTIRMKFDGPSMRPRSFERGKVVVDHHDAAVRHPSMRPRSFERGKGKVARFRTRENMPSMRPRSFERGKTLSRGDTRPDGATFNEAAFF